MSTFYEDFVQAINQKKVVSITVETESKGIITRKCIPFDFGPSRRYKDGLDRYHFWDINSPDGSHNLAVLPENLNDLVILDEEFSPADYVKWTPNWNISRNWGIYS